MNAHFYENATNSLEAVTMIETWKIEIVKDVNRIGTIVSVVRMWKRALIPQQSTTGFYL